MLEHNNNNKLALKIKDILDGKLHCNKEDLYICYYQPVTKEYNSIKSCMNEIKEKIPNYIEIDFLKEVIKIFEEKLTIYEQFFNLMQQTA